MIDVTSDFSNFGNIEIEEAGILLSKYSKNRSILDGDQIQVFFNPNSGCVFLSDENFNVALMNGDNLELFYTCPYCGHEGFLEEMYHEPEDEDCKQYMKEIGVPEFAEYEEEDE